MATQKGRNWSSGDIVTAANLSSIERGVSAVAEEYTPTTWANGNTVTAAGLNNIEQGIANAGGGGSSDFSTAQVTVNISPFNEGDYTRFVLAGTIGDYGGLELIDSSASTDTASQIITAVMYKGAAYLQPRGTIITSVSGAIELDGDLGMYVITGNCIINCQGSAS